MIQLSIDLEVEESTRDVLRQRLKRIAWRERVCDYHLDRIWRDLKINPP